MTHPGGAKLRHVIFIIIESGMALFIIQLLRLVFTNLPVDSQTVINALNYFIVIHQMFNVRSISTCFVFTDIIYYQGIAPTIIMVRVSMRLSFDDAESFKEGAGSLRFNNPRSDTNSTTDLDDATSSIGVPPQLSPQDQEKSEDT